MGAQAPPALADEIRDRQWYLSALDVANAHQITRGSGVAVVVVDTGVWADHPDLAGAVLPGKERTLIGDGRRDPDGHGTSMAGIIAGRGRGGSAGVLGIAPDAKIIPAAFSTTAFSDVLGINSGMSWAVDQGAKVINMSFVGEEESALYDGIRAMVDRDAVLVAANWTPEDAKRNAIYPGAYPEMLTVGAVDRAGNVANFSSANAQVDIVAPGVDMVSTGPSDKNLYRYAQGTSDSAAVVSGATALVRAKFPDLSAAEVVHRLTATAIDKGPPGRDDQYGYGMLNIVGALTADVPPLAATATPSPGADSGPGDASPPSTKSSVSPVVWILGGGGLLLVAGVVFLLFALRRRSAS